MPRPVSPGGQEASPADIPAVMRSSQDSLRTPGEAGKPSVVAMADVIFEDGRPELSSHVEAVIARQMAASLAASGADLDNADKVALALIGDGHSSRVVAVLMDRAAASAKSIRAACPSGTAALMLAVSSLLTAI